MGSDKKEESANVGRMSQAVKKMFSSEDKDKKRDGQ